MQGHSFTLLPNDKIFRLVQIESICKQMKGRPNTAENAVKKGGMLVASSFSFSNNVFFEKTSFPGLFGNGLTLYHTIPSFNNPRKFIKTL